jgi:hypothetical protein
LAAVTWPRTRATLVVSSAPPAVFTGRPDRATAKHLRPVVESLVRDVGSTS